MSETTTIRVSKETHQRFSALARHHHLSQPAYLAELVEQAERDTFWAAIAAIDPDEYQEAMSDEGLPDDSYVLEDRLITAEESSGDGVGETAQATR